MILTEWRTVTMKDEITEMCTSGGRQPLKQLLHTGRCSWKVRAVRKKRMRHLPGETFWQ